MAEQLDAPRDAAVANKLVNTVELLFKQQQRSDNDQQLDPGVFVAALSGIAMPRLIAKLICERANEGHDTFERSFADIGNAILDLFGEVFQDARADRLGRHHATNIERLVYNVVANVVSHFNARHWGCDPVFFWRNALSRAVDLLLGFVRCVRTLLPVAEHGAAWSDVQVLMYVLETINGTILYEDSRHIKTIAFLLFCDDLFRLVLADRRAHPEASIIDLSSAFGWAACSAAWRYVASSAAADTRVEKWTQNCAEFSKEVRDGFRPLSPSRPLSPPSRTSTEGSRKRAADKSPSSSQDSKKVRRALSDSKIELLELSDF